jgi:hypothetical protein
LAYLVPLDVDVTGNITAKLCEVWSEFNIFCTLVTHGNRGSKIMWWGDVRYCLAMAILVIITSPRLLSGDVLLFYVSFSLLLLFAYLVPLAVDVVPIRFHQFLFGE